MGMVKRFLRRGGYQVEIAMLLLEADARRGRVQR
jgi:hypothetical protein